MVAVVAVAVVTTAAVVACCGCGCGSVCGGREKEGAGESGGQEGAAEVVRALRPRPRCWPLEAARTRVAVAATSGTTSVVMVAGDGGGAACPRWLSKAVFTADGVVAEAVAEFLIPTVVLAIAHEE